MPSDQIKTDRNEMIPFFRIDEASFSTSTAHEGGAIPYLRFRMEANPVDGRKSGAMGAVTDGPARQLVFKVRTDLPAEGLFIDQHNTPPKEGQEPQTLIYVSSRELLNSFIDKNNLAQAGIKILE